MFIDFFYTLKNKGINVTLSEWLTLQEALDKVYSAAKIVTFEGAVYRKDIGHR